jgi:transmembrane sensor
VPSAEQPVQRSRGRSGVASWASLAAAAVALGAGLIFWPTLDRGERYLTDIGEQRSVPLSDGSVITLNTDTKLEVRFSGDSRSIELLAGQANFDVAVDPHRPFVVTAGERQVTALGTSFDVYRSSDRVTVTLLEGKVAVRERDEPDKIPEIAAAPGQQLSFDTRGGTVHRATVDVRRATAWRVRRLEFDDTPITDAIAEANRFSRQKIELDAPALSRAKVSGNFDAGDSEALADALSTYYELRMNRLQDGTILLTK